MYFGALSPVGLHDRGIKAVADRLAASLSVSAITCRSMPPPGPLFLSTSFTLSPRCVFLATEPVSAPYPLLAAGLFFPTFGRQTFAGVAVKDISSSDLESPSQVTLEDGTKLMSRRGVVVATNQKQAEKLLGKALDISPSKRGTTRGTCNLYFK